MIQINKIKSPFIYYCQKVIPLAFDESLSYYEVLCHLTAKIKEVIDEQNIEGQAIEELQEKYLLLVDYVDHYFDNLDVQEEINNKLDDMAESGELTDIIAQYLQLAGVLAFNTVDDLKNADNVANGSICKTLGFNTINDGGASYYKIRELINTDTIDEKYLISLDNLPTLVAEFMNIDKKINPFQFGAYGDGIHDDTSVLQYTIDYANTNKIEMYLPTPSNYFLISDGLVVGNTITGIVAEKWDYNGIIRPTGEDYTVLTLNVGMGFYMKNLSIGNLTSVDVNGILFTGYVGLTNFENIRVYNLNGYGFKINDMWDSVLTNISIEKCGNSDEYAFSINGDEDTTNMTTINRLQVEQSNTKAIYIDPSTLSCVFNNIHSERTDVVDNTYAWVFSGTSCTYNNARLHANLESKTTCCYLESVDNEYNNIRCEEYIKTIYEGSNGNNGLITSSKFDYLEEKTDQTGLINFITCNINEIKLKTRTHLNDCKITTAIVDWTSANDFPSFYNCNINTLDRSNNDARYYCDNCKIGYMYSDSVRDMHLTNCIITSIRENKISYSTGTFINTIFNSTCNIDYAIVNFVNCNINGNCDLLYGTQPYSFINTKISGTIGSAFGTTPLTTAPRGTKTENLLPTATHPSAWVSDGTNWLSLGNLS